MHNFYRPLVFVLLFLLNVTSSYSQCEPVVLQTEYLFNPLGIDAISPRLAWKIDDNRNAAKQTAYQLCVGIDSINVSRGIGNYWQPVKRSSRQQMTNYAGKKLNPFTKYYWSVKVWDKDGRASRWSSPVFFETGMMGMENWKGSWISDSRDVNEKNAPLFRKKINVTKKIKSARIYIASAGLHELSINGNRVGDHLLDPMYTRFDRRIPYVTHDVTSLLKNGDNVLGVLLGNGWYNHQSTAVWFFHEAPWRGRPAFMLDLRITYTDNTTEVISSNRDWRTTQSPVIFNSIYTAEHYDARKEINWQDASFADTAWSNSIFRTAPTLNIVSQSMVPIRAVDTIQMRSIQKFSDTNYVFDLGRNIAGVSELIVKGKRGTVIRLRHAERLYKNGHTDLSNIDVHYRPTDNTDPFQTDIFILKGEGEERFMPRFNYKGFQYVELNSSEPIELEKENLVAYFMHSDVRNVGEIKSSNPTVDKIWSAANNSYLSNLYGYPTDCPQREKNGWTGDAHIASETGLYSFDGITVYEKWMADHRDEQQPNGILPSIIPTDGWGYEWGNGPDWTSTIAIIPWNLYLFYGDTTALSQCYNNIKRYVDHINDLYPSGLTSWGLGDWVPVKSKTPVEFTSTAYYFTDVSILARAAALFGRKEDEKFYTSLAVKIKNAFNTKYLKDGMYGSGVQTELSVPLQWGLVPDSQKEKVAANLAKRVEQDGNHIDVGLLGTKAILNALSENGYAALAYRLATNETYPSWGWWIKNGATTLYENWPIDAASDISMNHIMFGEIGAWFFKGIGGIKPDPASPGFRNVLIEPHFVIDSFMAKHESPYGTIISSWKKDAGVIRYTITVPPNSSATLKLEGKVSVKGIVGKNNFLLEAGTYQFEVR